MISQLQNVHIISRKPREEIPAYLSHFDIGIIPFKINEMTKTMNTQKMYEYLAAGLPIVSTPLPEVKAFSDVISIGEDSELFLKNIEYEMNNDNNFKIKKRINAARKNSWKKRVEQINDIIRDYL